MPSPTAIADAIARCRAVGLVNAPTTDRDVELLAEVWLEDLEGLDDDMLGHACREHRRDPERGRFMPTPSEILARCPRTVDPDEAVFDAIRAGQLPELTEQQRVAIGRVGGSFAVRRIDDSTGGSFALAEVRKRFLAYCREPLQKRLPVPAVPQLPEPPLRHPTGSFTPWKPTVVHGGPPEDPHKAQIRRLREAIARREERDRLDPGGTFGRVAHETEADFNERLRVAGGRSNA